MLRHTRLWLLLLGLALSVAAPAETSRPPGNQPDPLERLLNPRPSPWLPNPRQMLELIAEAPMRELFRSLSDDRDWGPLHALWRPLLPEFRRSYLELVAPDPDALRVLLAERLRATLSDDELTELIEALDDPELERITRKASQLGLDLEVAMRAASLSAAPELYGPEEAEAIRVALSRLQGRDAEMQALEASLKTLSTRFARPAFVRYQAVMTDTLQAIAAARVADPEFQRRLDEWLVAWRERLRSLRS